MFVSVGVTKVSLSFFFPIKDSPAPYVVVHRRVSPWVMWCLRMERTGISIVVWYVDGFWPVHALFWVVCGFEGDKGKPTPTTSAVHVLSANSPMRAPLCAPVWPTSATLFQPFCVLLLQAPQLHSLCLDLSCNGLGDTGARRLAAGLRAGPVRLHTALLNLSHNRVQPDGAQALSQWLKASSAAEHLQTVTLRLSHNELGPRGARLLGTAAKHLSARGLRALELDLTCNGLHDRGVCALVRALQGLEAPALHDLCLVLDNNGVGDAGAAALAAWLAELRAPRLRDVHLRLAGNVVQYGGAHALAEGLQGLDLPQLHVLCLDLSCSRVGDGGACALAGGLKRCARLRGLGSLSLNLHNNGVGDAGARALAAALRESRAQLQLDFQLNRIGGSAQRALTALVACGADSTVLVGHQKAPYPRWTVCQCAAM